MPASSASGPFRLVGRLIPLDGSDDPEKPVFIDIPRALIVVEYEEHNFDDGYSVWTTTKSSEARIEMKQDLQTGIAFHVHQGAPPEGYFPPTQPPGFDF